MTTPNEALSASQSADPAGSVPQSTPDNRQARRDDRARELLRQTQTERDALKAQRDRLVDSEVRRLLSGRVADVDLALRATGKAAGDFVAEDGSVDGAAVTAFAEDLVVRAPGLRVGPPTVSGAGQHRVTSDQVVGVRRSGGWADLFASAGGRSDTGWSPGGSTSE